jgi:hypothetical protein
MSRSGTIIFNVKKSKPITIDLFIDSFTKNGWTMNVDGNIRYLPVGDNDLYDWKYSSVSNVKDVIHLLKEKQGLNEQIGFFLLLESEDVALEILVDSEISNIICTAHGDRKLISNANITDFTWYIERIVPILGFMALEFEQIECTDS